MSYKVELKILAPLNTAGKPIEEHYYREERIETIEVPDTVPFTEIGIHVNMMIDRNNRAIGPDTVESKKLCIGWSLPMESCIGLGLIEPPKVHETTESNGIFGRTMNDIEEVESFKEAINSRLDEYPEDDVTETVTYWSKEIPEVDKSEIERIVLDVFAEREEKEEESEG